MKQTEKLRIYHPDVFGGRQTSRDVQYCDVLDLATHCDWNEENFGVAPMMRFILLPKIWCAMADLKYSVMLMNGCNHGFLKRIIWEPIANANLRFMNRPSYLDIRDCKTLHRDWSAIGMRLMQSSIVYMGENHSLYNCCSYLVACCSLVCWVFMPIEES